MVAITSSLKHSLSPGTVSTVTGQTVRTSVTSVQRGAQLKTRIPSYISTTIKVAAIFLGAAAVAFLLSCDLDEERKWTYGNFALAHSRTVELSQIFRL